MWLLLAGHLIEAGVRGVFKGSAVLPPHAPMWQQQRQQQQQQQHAGDQHGGRDRQAGPYFVARSPKEDPTNVETPRLEVGAAWEAAVTAAEEATGKKDVGVEAAAAEPAGPVVEGPPEVWEDVADQTADKAAAMAQAGARGGKMPGHARRGGSAGVCFMRHRKYRRCQWCVLPLWGVLWGRVSAFVPHRKHRRCQWCVLPLWGVLWGRVSAFVPHRKHRRCQWCVLPLWGVLWGQVSAFVPHRKHRRCQRCVLPMSGVPNWHCQCVEALERIAAS